MTNQPATITPDSSLTLIAVNHKNAYVTIDGNLYRFPINSLRPVPSA